MIFCTYLHKHATTKKTSYNLSIKYCINDALTVISWMSTSQNKISQSVCVLHINNKDVIQGSMVVDFLPDI